MHTNRNRACRSGGARLRVVLAIAAAGLCVAGLIFRHRPTAPAQAAPAVETLRRDLVQLNGQWCRAGETNPFTGVMADYYPGGGRLARCELVDGRLNGLSESWSTNGQIQVREHFKHGVSDGLRERWHENGSRLSEATIIEGKVTGTFHSWHDNGQLSEEIEMKLGQPDGTAWAYYPSGFLKAETTVRDGQIIERKTWKDGERKTVQ